MLLILIEDRKVEAIRRTSVRLHLEIKMTTHKIVKTETFKLNKFNLINNNQIPRNIL